MKGTTERVARHTYKLYQADGPADGSKRLFRGPRHRHPYLVGTLRSRAYSRFRVGASQTRLVSLVVLAYWNYRDLGPDDDSGQPASTC